MRKIHPHGSDCVCEKARGNVKLQEEIKGLKVGQGVG